MPWHLFSVSISIIKGIKSILYNKIMKNLSKIMHFCDKLLDRPWFVQYNEEKREAHP